MARARTANQPRRQIQSAESHGTLAGTRIRRSVGGVTHTKLIDHIPSRAPLFVTHLLMNHNSRVLSSDTVAA
jgi:hypothetical protein